MHLFLLIALVAGLGLAQQTATQHVPYEPMVARQPVIAELAAQGGCI